MKINNKQSQQQPRRFQPERRDALGKLAYTTPALMLLLPMTPARADSSSTPPPPPGSPNSQFGPG